MLRKAVARSASFWVSTRRVRYRSRSCCSASTR